MARVFMRLIALVLIFEGILGFFAPFGGVLDLMPGRHAVDLGCGLTAVLVCWNETYSIALAKVIGLVYLVVGVLGLVTPNLLGVISSDPADAVIRLALAVAALSVGFSGSPVEVVKAS